MKQEVILTNAMFKVLVDNFIEGFLLVTESGEITYSNAACDKMFGYVPGELPGKQIEVLIPSYEVAKHPEHRKRFWDNPKPRYMGLNVMGKTRSGEEIPVKVGLIPFAQPNHGDSGENIRVCWATVRRIEENEK